MHPTVKPAFMSSLGRGIPFDTIPSLATAKCAPPVPQQRIIQSKRPCMSYIQQSHTQRRAFCPLVSQCENRRFCLFDEWHRSDNVNASPGEMFVLLLDAAKVAQTPEDVIRHFRLPL